MDKTPEDEEVILDYYEHILKKSLEIKMDLSENYEN